MDVLNLGGGGIIRVVEIHENGGGCGERGERGKETGVDGGRIGEIRIHLGVSTHRHRIYEGWIRKSVEHRPVLCIHPSSSSSSSSSVSGLRWGDEWQRRVEYTTTMMMIGIVLLYYD